MTVSFHKYGDYFPGTGNLHDIGIGKGKCHAINVPLRDGIDDVGHKSIFEPVVRSVIENYRPGAVVLQCGGDSLSGDRLGCFNLSMRGHANCVAFVKSFGLPTLVLGGGGYTIRNVARTWAFETGRLVDMDMPVNLPFTDYYEYYGPDFELDVKPSNMNNANTREYIDRVRTTVLDNIRRTMSVPSVQMQEVPRGDVGMSETLDEQESRLDDDEADQESNKDRRYTQRLLDRSVEGTHEPSECEDKDINAANGVKAPHGRDGRISHAGRHEQPVLAIGGTIETAPPDDAIHLADETQACVEKAQVDVAPMPGESSAAVANLQGIFPTARADHASYA